jgi:hypothetical protein
MEDKYMDDKNLIENEVKRGRGRPAVRGEANIGRLEIRVGRGERDALEHMLIESDKTKSDLVRKAIMLYYRTNYGRW